MAATAITLSASAEEVQISRFNYYGPVEVPQAVVFGAPSPVETKDIVDYEFDVASLEPTGVAGNVAVGSTSQRSLHALEFNIENRKFAKAQLMVEGAGDCRVTVDGEKWGADDVRAFRPGTHRVVVKYATAPETAASDISIKLKTDNAADFAVTTGKERLFTLDDVIYGTRIGSASLSPSGRYLLESKSDTKKDGTSAKSWRLYDLKAKTAARSLGERVRWMPVSDKFYAERTDYENGRHIVVIDPATGAEEVFARRLPEGNVEMGPTEEWLVFQLVRKGEKEDEDAYQVLEPDDRQPGWRDRNYAAIYRNGVMVPLTSGVRQTSLLDLSRDGKKALIMTSHSRLAARPTSLMSLITIDLATLDADTIVAEDGFLSNASFSPDGKKLIVTASPEAFSRIGCVLPADKVPSMSQQELFIVDVDTKEVKPMTRDFNPNPQSVTWSKYDGKVYFTAEKRDHVSLFRLDPATGKIEELALPENVVKGFSLSDNSPLMAVWGQSDSNPDRLYSLDTKSLKHTLLDEPSATRLADVKLGTCHDWNFVSERGDTVYGRYYLPDNFDPSKKYPLIVNYYGGCSPTTRTFESRYPHHLYSSLGYVVYVIEPSGATGFGQEWSSRHVSTAGQGVAEDIIEGTKKFAEEHAYVDSTKIGCIGASYGGFMTMYLQTQTPMFAAAISHAGISDHTSYWGEGYWGYNYSEVSMGNDKPWDATDLYVKQSPLYNAHKVRTPLLFLHGDGDTNVPPGESIQMFTALKLLGCPTALVEISGQNHHITDFKKRQKWQDTIFAWFAKYLQEDDSWWNYLYPAKDY